MNAVLRRMVLLLFAISSIVFFSGCGKAEYERRLDASVSKYKAMKQPAADDDYDDDYDDYDSNEPDPQDSDDSSDDADDDSSDDSDGDADEDEGNPFE